MTQEQSAASKPFIVLLVDDEPQILNLLRYVLVMEGCYEVQTASGGEEALEKSRRFPDRIDILITDVEMGVMNGVDLYQHIREERPEIKVLFISGKAEGFRKSLPKAPLLEKPFPLRKFAEAVREVLSGR